MTNKTVYPILLISIFSCLLLLIIEQVLQVNYLVKTLAKITLFLFLPLLYIRFILKENILDFLNLKKIDIHRLKIGLLFGILSVVVVIITFFIVKDFLNTKVIIEDLKTRLEITPKIYIFIALYIVFGNSLLEEFYFRGFIFLKIYQKGSKLLAYLFSSLLFALYHVAIFATWFHFWLILLAILGLFMIGLIFNWLNTKSNNFLNSWILHIMADIAVVTIGYYLFQIS
jgi:uncharacterized protein